MPSEIKRFISYLKDTAVKTHDRNGSGSAARPTHATDVDFTEIASLLSKYKDDDRIRNVLMDPSDEKLQGALDDVLQELKAVEGVSIAAYIEEAEPLNVLHGQIDNCNQLLERVEGRLGHFDTELNTVNREIQSLEEDSDQLSVMLRNRVQAADKLGSWLQDTTVPPSLVNAVVDGDVSNGKQFTATLKAVKSKHANMTSFAGHEHLPAFPTLKGLISTAAERVKAFVMTNIVSMKPRASAGASNAVVRRQNLLEYSEYILFLQEFAPAAHRAVLQRYCEDNGEYLLSTVRAYTLGLFSAVDKKQKPPLLTATESGQRLSGLFSAGTVEKDSLHCFEVGVRAEELLHPDFSQWPRRAKRGEPERTTKAYRPIPLQSLGNTKVPLEYAFKSLMNQLCDAGAGEYSFLRQFFGSDAEAIFEACWKAVLAMVSSEIEGQLQSYNDVLGLLIMTRIVGHCQLLMIHAQAPVLDGFLDRIGLTLWPHYSRLIRAHIDTVSPDKQNVKAKAMKPSVPCVLAPVQRWVRLFISVAKLNLEYSDSQILNNLDELAKALNSLLWAVRLLFAKPMQGHVFHILNLYYIVDNCRQADHAPIRTLLSSEALPQNSGGLGPAVMDICETFENSLSLCKKQYKEECLSSHMPDIFLYTMRAEKLLKSGASSASISKELGDVTLIRKRIRDFKDRWKQMVSIIRQEVHTNFAASEACQRDMTHTCLEEMYTQYKGFLEVLNAQGGEAKDAVAEGPTLQTLAYELREMVR